MLRRLTGAGLAAVVCSLAVAASAQAAPVTVSLRVEGPQGTVFEGPVTTDVAPFQFTGQAQQYRCDAGNGSVTRGAVLSQAAKQAGFPIAGTFSAQFGSPTFDAVGGQDVQYDAATGKYLAEYLDGTPSQLGSCGEAVTNGSRVLFAYATGAEPVLRLTRGDLQGSFCSSPEQPTFTYRVTDDATGAPVAGAAVGTGTTDASGNVTLPYNAQVRRATKAGSISSNLTPPYSVAMPACAAIPPTTDTTPATQPVTPPLAADTTPARGRVTSLRSGQTFSRGRGPRVLSGTATDDRGISEVRIRLSRSGAGRGCARYDGTRERFVRTKRCGIARARTFRVSTTADWQYQLPARLGPGRYVLDVLARDTSGNRLATSQLQRGTSRVVFTVR